MASGKMSTLFFFKLFRGFRLLPCPLGNGLHHLVNCSTIMDDFLNPGHSSYYPGFPLNLSIVVYREGVPYLPVVMHHLEALPWGGFMTDFDLLLCLRVQGPLSSVLSINKMQCYPGVLFKAVILLHGENYIQLYYVHMCCCPNNTLV